MPPIYLTRSTRQRANPWPRRMLNLTGILAATYGATTRPAAEAAGIAWQGIVDIAQERDRERLQSLEVNGMGSGVAADSLRAILHPQPSVIEWTGVREETNRVALYGMLAAGLTTLVLYARKR